jgi:hypothetical protein
MFVTSLTVAGAGFLEHSARHLLWYLAVFGSFTSTVYFGMVTVAAFRYGRLSRRLGARAQAIPVQSLPPVTVLKPVHGMEPKLEATLESYFRLPGFRNHLWRTQPGQRSSGGGGQASRQISARADPGCDFRRPILAECQGFFAGQNDRIVGQRLSGHQR